MLKLAEVFSSQSFVYQLFSITYQIIIIKVTQFSIAAIWPM